MLSCYIGLAIKHQQFCIKPMKQLYVNTMYVTLYMYMHVHYFVFKYNYNNLQNVLEVNKHLCTKSMANFHP